MAPPPIPANPTPLSPPERLSSDQSAAFMNWYLGMLTTANHSEVARAACLMPIDHETQAIVWKFISGGEIGRDAAFRLLIQHQVKNHLFKATDYPVSMLRTNLLVLECIRKEAPVAFDIANEADLAYSIHQSLRGYCYTPSVKDRVQNYSLGTEEELAALTAVTVFLHYASKNSYTNQYKYGDFKDAQGERVTGTRMTSQRLKDFLVEYPEDIHRVINYMSARDTAFTVKDTKELIQHLRESEDFGALDQGWL
jgi:hypothetical protein